MKHILILLEAWCMLAIARILLLLLPFRKLAPLLGKRSSPESEDPYIPLYHTRLTRISTAILKAAAYAPWRTQCFEQALAARLMLRFRGLTTTVFFGVSKSKKKGNFNAHAWLQCNGLTITGGKQLEQFTIIACFKS
jgi:hypothetical protein